MSQTVDTRTVHVITIDLQDQVLERIAAGDEVEVVFRSRTEGGRIPRPIKLSYSQVAYLTGANKF